VQERNEVSTPEAWQIPSPADACAQCQAALQPDDQVTVQLVLEDDGPARRDLCSACGEAVGNVQGAFFWRQRRHERGDERPVVDYAFLREMFGRMLERPEEVYRRLAYLVGLVLIRKRHLRLKGFERRDGHEVMVVTRGKDEPDQVVPAPFLSAEDMVATRELLSRLMASDLPEEEDLLATGQDDEQAAEGGPDDDESAGPRGTGSGASAGMEASDAAGDTAGDDAAPELN